MDKCPFESGEIRITSGEMTRENEGTSEIRNNGWGIRQGNGCVHKCIWSSERRFDPLFLLFKS
jgi:hypothetical protein